MFEQLVEILKEHGHGVRAFQECAQAARKRVEEEPDVAASFFLLGAVAQKFVDFYEGEPLDVQIADRHFELFESFATELDTAWASGAPKNNIDALNSISVKVLNQFTNVD